MATEKPLFPFGQIVATCGVIALDLPLDTILALLRRHQSGDWGCLCKEDKELNDLAVEHEGDPEKQGRVLSSYRTAKGSKIWIITEWDRSATTILLPSEY